MTSLQKKGLQVNDVKRSNPHRGTGLNPNAAEFIPFSLISSVPRSSNSVDATIRLATAGTLGKAVLDRSESSVSNNSDDEAHQYWCRQLPDDITPDFNVIGDDDSQVFSDLSLPGLSLRGDDESSSIPAPKGSGFLVSEHQGPSQQQISGGNLPNKLRISGPRYSADLPSNFLHMSTKCWDRQIGNGDQLASIVTDGVPFDSRLGFPNDVLGEGAIMNETDIDPLKFLASQFPGFSAESLADLFFANGCELSLTIEMLTQFELEIDNSFNRSLNTKTMAAPNLDTMDNPALTAPDGHQHTKYANGIQLSNNPYQSIEKDNRLFVKSASSLPSRGSADFASAVRDSGMWKCEKNGSTNTTIGSSGSSHVLAGSNTSGHGRGMYGDRLQNCGSFLVPSVWRGTGDVVANLYSEMQDEAHDHARLHNAYFEQVRQAYAVSNKALAKELSVKGQMHNMHMKAAHGKAQESIYRQRIPVATEVQGNGRVERMIDLHGLNVSEALHVLKNELNVLRDIARTAGQRLQVYICVGTGHHIRGSRTAVRLPIAVQRYLLEAEGLEYTEPQAGLLRVVIY